MSLSNPSSLNDFFGPGPRIDVTQRRVSRATDVLRQFTEAQRDYKHRLRCRLQFIKWISLSELYRLKRRLKTHKHIQASLPPRTNVLASYCLQIVCERDCHMPFFCFLPNWICYPGGSSQHKHQAYKIWYFVATAFSSGSAFSTL